VNQDQKTRIGGLFFIVCGAVLGYLAIWRPYQSALGGSASVSLNRMGIALAIVLPLAGAILVAGGEAASDHIKAQTVGKKTRLGWVYLLLIAAISLAVFLLVQSKFAALGYTD
jgi:drug/metabolite transporter (DMT)-like permease